VLHLSASCRYYLYRKPVNMRKSFDGLSGLVQSELKKDPLNGAVFIFLNRRHNQVKLLLWEGDGFCLYHKRLEKGSFELPDCTANEMVVHIEADQLLLLLKGISLRHVRRLKRYQHRGQNVNNDPAGTLAMSPFQ
jgi:transposase